MRRAALLIATVALLALSGCSSDPSRPQINNKKAAQSNADLGLRYMLQGKYEVAMQKLERSLEYDENYAPAHHYMAELYRRLGRNEDANEHFREAINNSDKDYMLYNNYGAFLCSWNHFDEGEKQFLKVLDDAVYPRRDQVYENLGLCMERKPDMAKAEKYLREALKLNPKQPKTLLSMARISYSQENYLSTRAYLQRYLDLTKHTPETLWLGIRTERHLGDRNAVSSYGMLLKANFPDADETKLYLQSEK